MPYTSKQLAFFRVAMHDPKKSKKEKDEYRRMYNEGKAKPRKKPVKKVRKHGRTRS